MATAAPPRRRAPEVRYGQQLSVRIPPAHARRLDALADAVGRPRAALVRDAIERFLADPDTEADSA